MTYPRLDDLYALAEIFGLTVISDNRVWLDLHAPGIIVRTGKDQTANIQYLFNGQIVASDKLPIPEEFQVPLPPKNGWGQEYQIMI